MKFFLILLLCLIAFPVFAATVPHDTMEWTRMWTDHANSKDLPRVLMIGDSICNGYRDYTQKELEGKVYVDQLVSSRALDQEYYWKQLELPFMEQKYDLILFNFGLHGFHIGFEDYGKGLEKLADFLKTKSSNLCFVLTTPMDYMSGDKTAIEINAKVIKRNEVAKKVMSEKGIKIFDLYTPIDGKSDIRAGNKDYYHYNEAGKKYQAKIVSEKIIELLK